MSAAQEKHISLVNQYSDKVVGSGESDLSKTINHATFGMSSELGRIVTVIDSIDGYTIVDTAAITFTEAADKMRAGDPETPTEPIDQRSFAIGAMTALGEVATSYKSALIQQREQKRLDVSFKQLEDYLITFLAHNPGQTTDEIDSFLKQLAMAGLVDRAEELEEDVVLDTIGRLLGRNILVVSRDSGTPLFDLRQTPDDDDLIALDGSNQ